MTDFRDPSSRAPNSPLYRDPMGPSARPPMIEPDDQSWSMATWGWIGGIAVVVLIAVVMVSNSSTIRTAGRCGCWETSSSMRG